MTKKRVEFCSQNIEDFIKAVKAGKEKETARAISLLENKNPLGRKIMQHFYQNYSKPYIIGITGPAGSGKSSILNLMLKEWLKKFPEDKIAVIAVDPSSHQSGGAFLGDRIRMKNLINDQRVFIRSMASRGSIGGVNTAVYDTAVILAAAGYKKIIIETIGVGQSEIDIVSLSDTTLVVTVPDAGDEIQIFKSELMEIGDIFILNKSDLPQAAKMEVMIKALFSLKENSEINGLAQSDFKDKEEEFSADQEKAAGELWEEKLIKTSALNNEGIRDLIQQIEEHYNYLNLKGLLIDNKKLQLKKHLFNLIHSEIAEQMLNKFSDQKRVDELIGRILEGKSSPYQLAEEFIDNNLTI